MYVSYSESADFKFAICFWKFRAQIPKFRHFGPESMNFLILAKLCISPISKVLISNLTLVFENFESKCPNLGIWAFCFKKYHISNLNKILSLTYLKLPKNIVEMKQNNKSVTLWKHIKVWINYSIVIREKHGVLNAAGVCGSCELCPSPQ